MYNSNFSNEVNIKIQNTTWYYKKKYRRKGPEQKCQPAQEPFNIWLGLKKEVLMYSSQTKQNISNRKGRCTSANTKEKKNNQGHRTSTRIYA